MGLRQQKAQSAGQWSVAVALIICAIFAAAIALKAKSDLDNYRTNITAELSQSAQNAGNIIDREFMVVRARLAGVSLSDANSFAGNLVTMPQISDVSIFDAYGAPTTNSTASGNVLSALSAAAVLATHDGWFGTIALSKTFFKPSLAIKNPNGEIVTATLNVPHELGLNPNISAIVADKNGHIVSASDKLKINSIGDIRQALNFQNRTPNDFNSGEINSLSGEKYFFETKQSQSGFVVYTLEVQSIYNAYMLRLLLYYALLFMGPVLAYFGILYVIKDQSAGHKYQQAKASDTERRLKIAVESAKCGIWEWNLSDNNIYLSPRAARFFGFGAAGVYAGDDFMASLSPQNRFNMREALNNASKSGIFDSILELTTKPNPKTSEAVKYSIQLRGKMINAGKKGKKVLVTGMVNHIPAVPDTIAKPPPKDRLQEIIEALAGPFAFWGADGKLIAWNNSFISRFALANAQISQGMKYSEVSKIAAKAVISQKNNPTDKRVQDLLFKDGKWLRMMERKTADGNLLSIGFDISSHKATEVAMAKSTRQLEEITRQLNSTREESQKLARSYEAQKVRAEEAYSAKSSFLANMSHELRTPLNAINGFSQMMADELYGPLGDPRYNEYSQSILASGRHLLELINDVLDMAKIEAGKFNIYPRPMSMSETISQAIHMLSIRANEKNILIETDIDPRDDIHADQRAIRQIIINLLSNAIKFTNAGGRVLIRTREEGDNMVLSVIDTGIGIDQKHLPRLGYAFEQVEHEHSKASQGTGLGLALCRAFAEMHGGNISIISKIGVGTRVNITLPKDAEAIEAAA